MDGAATFSMQVREGVGSLQLEWQVTVSGSPLRNVSINAVTVFLADPGAPATYTTSGATTLGAVGLSAATFTETFPVVVGTAAGMLSGDSVFEAGVGQADLNRFQEVPPPATSTMGTGTAVVRVVEGSVLWISVTVAELTGPVLAAHVHGPAAPGATGGPQLVLTELVGATHAVMLFPLTDDQLDWLQQGLLYVNVHTAANMGGEIRGNIEVLPTDAVAANPTFTMRYRGTVPPSTELGRMFTTGFDDSAALYTMSAAQEELGSLEAECKARCVLVEGCVGAFAWVRSLTATAYCRGLSSLGEAGGRPTSSVSFSFARIDSDANPTTYDFEAAFELAATGAQDGGQSMRFSTAFDWANDIAVFNGKSRGSVEHACTVTCLREPLCSGLFLWRSTKPEKGDIWRCRVLATNGDLVGTAITSWSYRRI